jgi:uncharacterized RDD family membrane protein YckC
MEPNIVNNVEVIKPQVVSPVESLQYAGFWRRFLASSIDSFILLMLGVIVGFLLGIFSSILGLNSTSSVYTMLKSIVNVLMYLVGIVYYIYYTGHTGQTFGKRAMGIKVVRLSDNLPIGYTGAFLREIVGKFISAFVLLLGYIWMLWDSNKQTWHDKIANSVVIKI